VSVITTAIARPFDRAEVRRSLMDLPAPAEETHSGPMMLTLRDAVLLALRTNPNIESYELQRVLDKFALDLAHDAFAPHFTLAANYNLATGIPPTYSLNPSVQMQTPIGTTINFAYANSLSGGGQQTLTLTQPLLQGAGEVNAVPLKNAMDSELVNRLNFKNNVISVVVAVVQAYRTLMGDYNTLKVQANTLREDKELLQQYELQVKAGQLARSELTQQKASFTQTQLSYKQQEQQINQDYQAFLTSIGLRADAKVTIRDSLEVDEHYQVPDLQQSIQEALANNISYQSALINLRATERGLITARDQQKWSLNLTYSSTGGSTTGSEADSIGDDPTAGEGNTAGLALSIPLNNLSNEQAVKQAEIALENAKIVLAQQQRQLVSTVTQQVIAMQNQVEQIKIAKQNVMLQQEAYDATKLKQQYGRATAFELSQQQDNLVQAQISLITAQIGLLNDITTYNQIMAKTLDVWDIKLRY